MDFSEIIVQPVMSTPFAENAYLVSVRGASSCLIVDPGLEPERILDALAEKKLEPVAILVTHGHADHIGGVREIKKAKPDCVVYIGEEEQDKLIDADANLSAPFGLPVTAPPADILLKGGETIEIAGVPIEARLAPGHSRGHLVYLVPTEPKAMMFVGDVIFRQSIGRSDFPDGDHDTLIRSIRQKILSLPDDTVLYPGHGPATTVGAERRTNPFLS